MQAGVYRHFKGGYYQVLAVSGWSGNSIMPENTLLVTYVALTGAHLPGPRVRTRTLKEFMDFLDTDGSVAPESTVERAVEGNELRPRFQYVGDEIPAGNLDIPRRPEANAVMTLKCECCGFESEYDGEA